MFVIIIMGEAHFSGMVATQLCQLLREHAGGVSECQAVALSPFS
jgi:hypothetical protein